MESRLRERLGGLISELSRSEADCRWVRPENLHLTLRFLGETAAERVPGLKEALDRAVEGSAVFDAAFGRIGGFPSLEAPRVLWVGLSEGEESLRDLAQALCSELEVLGIPGESPERAFRAHLTLGRLKGRRNIGRLKESLKACSERFAEGWPMRVDRVRLMRSRLSGAGPVYEVLKEARLRSPRTEASRCGKNPKRSPS